MRRWILWLLVLVLGFFGAVGSSILSHEVVAAETVEVPMESLQTVEGDSDNAVEVDGVRLEILVPERTWVIPENKPGSETPVQLGFRLTNLRQEAVGFPLINPIPTIIDPNGKRLWRSGGRDRLIIPSPLVCRLLAPGESVTFFPEMQLVWDNDQLYLAGLDGVGGSGFYEGIKTGTYQVGLLYDTNISFSFCFDIEDFKQGTSMRELTQGYWIDFAETPLVEIYLVEI